MHAYSYVLLMLASYESVSVYSKSVLKCFSNSVENCIQKLFRDNTIYRKSVWINGSLDVFSLMNWYYKDLLFIKPTFINDKTFKFLIPWTNDNDNREMKT